ncbi:DUF3726 domain-containing protein [Parasedimentitalea psychrophila]|uniref:DUF3726 domain-containing protein n=1 Tax=Parasedimentitalea psychrophila TaxID=2997337 RepID=A0A9Y2P5V7_9RHOB|nr:DUF3726 domain-containing protein [Parasedimentitalea psychrophila]WIY24363.1 DUF3726 domain-containing protein [Parasedimentitalea psychrophila]
MSYSLNEVEALSKRAARGAGLDWGFAEEASKATRWLCAQDLDGCRLLSSILDAYQDNGRHLHAPLTLTGEWHTPIETLCPVQTGASLSDCAAQVASDGVEIRDLSNPLFILPFVAAVARVTKTCLLVTWEGASITTDGNTVDLRFSAETTPYVEHADRLVIAQTAPLTKAAKSPCRANPSSQNWEELNSLAALTYAPATETSRRLGAGGGQTDND